MDMQPIVLVLSAIADGVGDFIGELLTGLAVAVIALIRAVFTNRNRLADLEDEIEIHEDPTRLERDEQRLRRHDQSIHDIKRYFEGDPNDPDNDGILHEIHDIKQAVDPDDED